MSVLLDVFAGDAIAAAVALARSGMYADDERDFVTRLAALAHEAAMVPSELP